MDSLILETSAICVTTAAGVGAFALLSAIARQGGGRPPASWPAAFGWLRPLTVLLDPVAETIHHRMKGLRKRTAERLTAAGFGHGMTPNDLLALRLVLGLLLLAATMPFRFPMPLVFGVLGLVLPDLYVMSAIQERHAAIRRDMPYAIDLLALCTLAGLEFGMAVDRVVARMNDGPLKEEWQLLRREMTLGRSLTEALLAMARRIQMAEMTSFTAVLVQGLEMGSGVAAVLSAQAEKMRLERMEKAERGGAKAQQKILLPLLLLMLPAFACLIFIPFLVSQIRAYWGGFAGG